MDLLERLGELGADERRLLLGGCAAVVLLEGLRRRVSIAQPLGQQQKKNVVRPREIETQLRTCWSRGRLSTK